MNIDSMSTERIWDHLNAKLRSFLLQRVSDEQVAEDLLQETFLRVHKGAKSRVQRGRAKLKSLLFDCCSFERDRRGNVIGYVQNSPGDCDECDTKT